LAFAGTGRITFKIGTDQIIQQNIKFDVKQTLPAIVEIGKKIPFMFDNPIQAAI